jgi:hypothetical protein
LARGLVFVLVYLQFQGDNETDVPLLKSYPDPELAKIIGEHLCRSSR